MRKTGRQSSKKVSARQNGRRHSSRLAAGPRLPGDGVRISVTGLVFMAVSMAGVYAERMFGVWNMAEFGAIALTFIGWLLVWSGTGDLCRRGAIHKRTAIMALIMAAVTVAQAAMAFRNVHAGLGEQSFIDFSVMLLSYIGLLGMFYVYYRLLTGMAYQVKRNGGHALGLKCERIWKKSFIVIILVMIIMPLAALLPKIIEYCATVILILILLAVQLHMCSILNECRRFFMERAE